MRVVRIAAKGYARYILTEARSWGTLRKELVKMGIKMDGLIATDLITQTTYLRGRDRLPSGILMLVLHEAVTYGKD